MYHSLSIMVNSTIRKANFLSEYRITKYIAVANILKKVYNGCKDVMQVAIEYELKFRATAEVLQKLQNVYAQNAVTYQMETTYYDTPSGALSARHYTLRRRMENDLSVCTLKCPAPDGRLELETRCGSIEEALPKLYQMGAPAELPELVQEGLIPVCGAKFARLAATLTLEECTVELALDQGVLTGGEQTVPLCEAEVELKSGNKDAATLFALELAQQYGLCMENRSKFRRALALYKGEAL